MATICSEQKRSAINLDMGGSNAFQKHRVPLLSLVPAYGRRLLHWVERRAEQRENRDAFAHLLKLDDSLLQDIGVIRADVERAAKLPLAEDAAKVLYESAGRSRDNHV